MRRVWRCDAVIGDESARGSPPWKLRHLVEDNSRPKTNNARNTRTPSGQSAYIDASGRAYHAGEHHGKRNAANEPMANAENMSANVTACPRAHEAFNRSAAPHGRGVSEPANAWMGPIRPSQVAFHCDSVDSLESGTASLVCQWRWHGRQARPLHSANAR